MNHKRLRFLAARTGKPLSVPSPLPQPRRRQYATSALNLFTGLGSPGLNGGYSRQSFLDAFGVDAPPFDPSRPTQSWFDSTAKPDGTYEYNVLGRNHLGLPTLEKKTMLGKDARVVNLTGGTEYPTYVVEPTNGYQDLGSWGHASINPVYLSTKEQAEELMKEWTDLGLNCHDLHEQNDPNFPYVWPDDEERRVWIFTCDGAGDTGWVYPGVALADKNAEGVGHPGEWDLSDMEAEGPKWLPDEDPPEQPADPNNVIVMPLRDLKDNERLILASAGMTVMVERTYLL